jgi:hypothetical protein
MTEFSTLLLTTTPSCSAAPFAVTYEISSVSGSTVAPTGLNAVDVSDGTNIKITPTDASSTGWKTHEFYIRATLTSTGTVWESSKLTFHHGCTLSGDSSFVTSLSTTEGATQAYTIQGLSTNSLA